MDSMAGNRTRTRASASGTTTDFPGEEPVEPQLSNDCESFLVAWSEYKNPFLYVFNLVRYGGLAQTTAPDHVFEAMNKTTTWQQRLSLFAMQMLHFLNVPLAAVGRTLEIVGNTVVTNGGVLRTLLRLTFSAIFLFKKGDLIVPSQEAGNYRTLIGLLDPRTALLSPEDTARTASGSAHVHFKSNVDEPASRSDIFPGPGNGDKRIADVMLMAAKLAYENEAVITEVVTQSWKMKFVGNYNCWNEYQQRSSKQVVVFTDKAQDANAVVVSWRGTEPFSTYDWSTDLDFSWFDLKDDTGKVHLGFLEALGLGDRTDMDTFAQLRRNGGSAKTFMQRSLSDRESPRQPPAASGLSQSIIDAPDKILAYDYVTKIVKQLLESNPNAKLFLSGHSLGGALAMLYAGMLYYFGEQMLADRIGAVYTFGQPRVGDQKFGNFMLENLTVERYYRMVYCNDVVPRVPFDDRVFNFKHWGLCYYFNSFFEEQTLKEAPNPNFFSIMDFVSVHLNAVWELVSSVFILGYKYGSEYKQSTASFLFRILALALPGIGDHSPVNYVNALRLGMPLVAEPTQIHRAVRSHAPYVTQIMESS